MGDHWGEKPKKRRNPLLSILMGIGLTVVAYGVSKVVFTAAFSPPRPQSEEEWRAFFREKPMFEALAEFDPVGLQEMEDVFVQAALEGKSLEEFGDLGFQSSETGRRFAEHYALRATDERLVAFQEAALGVIHSLEASPQHCYNIFIARDATSTGLSEADRVKLEYYEAAEKIVQAITALKDGAATDPVRIENPLAAEEELQEIFATAARTYPRAWENMTQGIPPADSVEMAEMCRISAMVSELTLASANAADIFRIAMYPLPD